MSCLKVSGFTLFAYFNNNNNIYSDYLSNNKLGESLKIYATHAQIGGERKKFIHENFHSYGIDANPRPKKLFVCREAVPKQKWKFVIICSALLRARN